jgi:hypothetical protein
MIILDTINTLLQELQRKIIIKHIDLNQHIFHMQINIKDTKIFLGKIFFKK